MPIITRKRCQGIFIGHEIEVRVFRVRNGQVRFGLTAPRDVLILRSELPQGRRQAEIPWRTSPGRKAARRLPPDSVER